MRKSRRYFAKVLFAGALMWSFSARGTTSTESVPSSVEQKQAALAADVDDLRDQVLLLQDALAPGGVYTIRPGDTYAKISRLFGLRLDLLMVMNPGVDPARLKVGMLLRVKAVPKANQSPQPTPPKGG